MVTSLSWLFCIIGLSYSAVAHAQGLVDRDFDQRLSLFSEWANQRQTRGRSLAWAPEAAPATETPPTETPPTETHVIETPDTESQSSEVPVTSNLEVSGPPTPPTSSESFLGAGYGFCKVLRYHTGYANLTLNYNKIIKDTPNFGECCKRCDEDEHCQAWTRVAGGDAPNFRNCYLKYDLKDLDDNLEDARKNNHVGPQTIAGRVDDATIYPELRYVNEGYEDPDFPVILESGTKPDVYPPVYYGCPYYPTADQPCVAPKTCNVDGSGNFVAPPCIE